MTAEAIPTGDARGWRGRSSNCPSSSRNYACAASLSDGSIERSHRHAAEKGSGQPADDPAHQCASLSTYWWSENPGGRSSELVCSGIQRATSHVDMNPNGAPRSLVKFRKLTQITKIMQDNSSEGFHPPKPRLTLRIGITGHRPNKLSGSAAERIKTQLERVFSAIEEAANGILKANATIYANELPQLRLVSAFAEGADQLAVSVSPSNWMIDGILPFPKDEYLRDFSNSALGDNRDVRSEFLDCLGKASNVTQFPFPRRHKREQGYLNSGSYLLRQIDILISIWDGTPQSLVERAQLRRRLMKEAYRSFGYRPLAITSHD